CLTMPSGTLIVRRAARNAAGLVSKASRPVIAGNCRVVYLPMGYLYGRRATATETPLLRALRTELYPMSYADIDWAACRDYLSPLDRYMDLHWILTPLFAVLNAYERVHSTAIRARALATAIDHIHQEDRNTNWIDIG